MSAGLLRDYVKVLTPVTASDGVGGQTVDWVNATYVYDWANIRAATSREQAAAGAIQLLATHMVQMHYSDRIAVTNRLERVEDGLTLEVVGKRDPDGRKRYLELTCAEVQT